jgi:peptidoglycan/LPS O-acetylase OafA/YrhL
MKRTKPYFPALDGFRFIAFLSIFFHHVTFYLRQRPGNNGFWQFFNNNGWVGVDFFFVLTGFLITYLLLIERKESGRINYYGFVGRRIRRLGPLYFMALVSGFFLAPVFFQYILQAAYITSDYWKWVINTLPWYAVMSGNWNTAFYGWGNLRSISQLWAICVDWQFYLIWPLVLLQTKNLKQILAIGSGMIVFSVAFRALLVGFGVVHPGIYTDTFARLDPFAAGVIIAAILFYRPDFFANYGYLYKSAFQLLSIIILAIYLYFADAGNRLTVRNGIFGYLPIEIIFSYLVISLVSGKSSLTRVISAGPIKYLGTLGYGLYVWHVLSLELVYYAWPHLNSPVAISFLALSLTVITAYLTSNPGRNNKISPEKPNS